VPENYFNVEYDYYLGHWFLHYEGEMILLAADNYDAALDEALGLVEVWA
jgi:hypothetical protein